MTEFITRVCHGESRYEVIIKTDNEGHCKAAEDFARSLIGHEKPHPVPECECWIDGCHERATCGTLTKDGYKRVCVKHCRELQEEAADGS